MQREVGDRQFPIWLLGDSEPEAWRAALSTPFDPRHPTRHSIWTPILEVIQDNAFRQRRERIDTSRLFIRNAIGDPGLKPHEKNATWGPKVKTERELYSALVEKYRPKLVLSFGSFAFEFARRALYEMPQRGFGYWTAGMLGDEFRKRLNQIDIGYTNLIPLLHHSIASSHFMQTHKAFCKQDDANYFEYVGTKLAEKLLAHSTELSIWIA